VGEVSHFPEPDELERVASTTTTDTFAGADDVDVRIGGVSRPVDELDLGAQVVLVTGNPELTVEEDPRRRPGRSASPELCRRGSGGRHEDGAGDCQSAEFAAAGDRHFSGRIPVERSRG